MKRNTGKLKKRVAAAIVYDKTRDRAPRLLARGEGSLAERIITVAKGHDIRIVENGPVSELLQCVSPGVEIPEQLYRAVAGILALVYELDGREKKRGEM